MLKNSEIKDFDRSKLFNETTTTECENLIPIQIDKSGNYNILVAGKSGDGKSILEDPIQLESFLKQDPIFLTVEDFNRG